MGVAYTPQQWDEWTARMRAEHGNGNGHGKSLAIEAQRLLRTPTAQLAVNGGSQHPDKRKDGGHGPTLADEVEHLLPTPRADEGGGNGQAEALRHSPGLSNVRTHFPHQDWCEYDAAIRRHETAFGRTAPPPTQPGRNGQPRLSPAFVEWLMGLPAGHVIGVPGLTRNDQLKALGNGVVPQQAAAAARAFLHDMAEAVA
jgi:DNA (cytosine-5)-methyltransferase 1